MELSNARCLVTGGSSGLGRAIATALTRARAVVAVTGQDSSRLDEVATICRHLRQAEFPEDAAALAGGHALVADLAEPGAAEAVVERATLALGGRLDVLVCNAGVGWAGPLVAMAPSEADWLLDVNLRAPIHLIRAALPSMLDHRGGHVVLIGSVAGHLGVPGEVVYSATKAALVGMADSLRSEVAPAGIGVSLVSPGAVATGFFTRRNEPYGRSFPRPIRPEVVADVVVASIRDNRARALVPGWLSVPVRLHGALPHLYQALAQRFDPAS